MAVMSTRGKQGADRRDALIAKAATVAADALGR
jgi:beta-lactamase class A